MTRAFETSGLQAQQDQVKKLVSSFKEDEDNNIYGAVMRRVEVNWVAQLTLSPAH